MSVYYLQKKGEPAILSCACDSEDPAAFVPMGIQDGENDIICGLICPKCENVLTVEYGIIENNVQN